MLIGGAARGCRSTARVDLDPHPDNAKAPPAAVRRWGGKFTRRRVAVVARTRTPGQPLDDRRLRVHSARRSGVTRGEPRSLNSGAVGTDGHESQGGYARHARPRGGQPGQVAVGGARHGRERPVQDRTRPSGRRTITRLSERCSSSLGTRAIMIRGLNDGPISTKSRRRRCAECTTLAVPTSHALRGPAGCIGTRLPARKLATSRA